MSKRRRPVFMRGRRRTLALALVVSASVVTPIAVTSASRVVNDRDSIAATAGSAVPTGTQEVALGSAPAATGVTSDIAGGAAGVKEVTSPTPFSIVGVTWRGFYPKATANIRAKQSDGSWGPWYEAESVDGKSDTTGTERGGTEPVFIGPDTTSVQIAVEGVDLKDTSIGGAPAAEAPSAPANSASPAPVAPEAPKPPTPAATEAPAADISAPRVSAPQDNTPPIPTAYADIKPVAENTPLAPEGTNATAVLISPDNTPTPPADMYGDIAAQNDTQGDIATRGGNSAAKGGTGANRNTAAAMPKIISRAGWGADESIRCQAPSYDDSLAAATVHHTAGSNNYTREQSAGIMRGIYVYHASNLGWCDVGYNVLVDKYGQAFEGRAGGLTKNVQGAHAGGFNGNTFGISMMGDFSTVAPPEATIKTVGEVIGWRLSIAGVDPKGKDTHYSEGTPYAKYPAGAAVTLPNIFAHRDVGLTSCPGDAGYAKMNQIRDIAAKYAAGGNSGGGNSGGGTTPPGGSPSTPPPTGGGTTSPGTGSAATAVADLIKKVLSGQKIDATTLMSLLAGGKKLSDIPITTDSATKALGGNIGKLFESLKGAAGPLGKLLSGVQKFGNISLVKTENGAIYESDTTGTHAVWGKIGDAWAAQDYERGPLGMPIAEETTGPDGKISQRFEKGVLTFNPDTGLVEAEPAK